jgi:hypothetical protein
MGSPIPLRLLIHSAKKRRVPTRQLRRGPGSTRPGAIGWLCHTTFELDTKNRNGVTLILLAAFAPAVISSIQSGNESTASTNLKTFANANTAYQQLFPSLGYAAKAAYLGGTTAQGCPQRPLMFLAQANSLRTCRFLATFVWLWLRSGMQAKPS